MAQYDTKAVTMGDITVTVSKKKDATAGERLKALLEFIASKLPVDPGYGVGSERPDNSLPGSGGRPSHPIAPGGSPGRPDNTLPGGGEKPSQGGERPDNTLPGSQPGVDNSLPGDFLRDHADEIVKAVLGKCVDCRPESGPK